MYADENVIKIKHEVLYEVAKRIMFYSITQIYLLIIQNWLFKIKLMKIN